MGAQEQAASVAISSHPTCCSLGKCLDSQHVDEDIEATDTMHSDFLGITMPVPTGAEEASSPSHSVLAPSSHSPEMPHSDFALIICPVSISAPQVEHTSFLVPNIQTKSHWTPSPPLWGCPSSLFLTPQHRLSVSSFPATLPVFTVRDHLHAQPATGDSIFPFSPLHDNNVRVSKEDLSPYFSFIFKLK